MTAIYNDSVNATSGECSPLLSRTICSRLQSETRERSWPSAIAGLSSVFDSGFGFDGRLGQSIVRGLAEPQIDMAHLLSTISVEIAGRRRTPSRKIVSAKNSMFKRTWSS